MSNEYLRFSEPDLVQLLLGGDLDEARRDDLRALCSKVEDWESFGRYCESHGIGPLVSKIFSSISGIPPIAIRIFEDITLRSLARCTVLIHRLRKILHEFKSQNIAALLLKGPVLAESVYPNPVLRPFEDLDLLIMREDMGRAVGILQRIGFSELGGEQEKRFVDSGFHRKFLASDGTPVELHWEFLPPDFRAFSAGAVWEKARNDSLYGTEIRTLSQHDEFIYACIHMAKHVSSGSLTKLIWLYDLEYLLPTTIPRKLTDRIRRLGCRRMVYFAVALLNRFRSLPLKEIKPWGRSLEIGPVAREFILRNATLNQVFDTHLSWRRKLYMRSLMADNVGTVVRFPVSYIRRHLIPVSKPGLVVH